MKKMAHRKKFILLSQTFLLLLFGVSPVACSFQEKENATRFQFSPITINPKVQEWKMDTNTLISYEKSKEVPIALSTTDKNVLIIGIDTLGNSELEFLKDSSNKEYKSQIFDNFLNYKNIVAAGRSTNTGVPAILGGWMANPLLWSDKRIDVYNPSEQFKNLDKRNDLKQMYTWQDYQRNNYKEFVNAINHIKYDFKALNTEYFAGGDELKGDSISVEGFKKFFPQVESAFQYWKKTNGSQSNIYKNQYTLDYPKLKWHHNYFEKMRKNLKTYKGKGKFNWSWSQQLHPGFFLGDPTNPRAPKTIQERENNEFVVKHTFHQIAKMFEKMKKDKVWNNTLIFIISDHGYKIREESIMLIKPWNSKGKYQEMYEVMLSNYDFPMILKTYLKEDFDASFYKRALDIQENLFATKSGEKIDNYVEKPLDPQANKRTQMFNVHHDWNVHKSDEMLNFVNYFGNVLQMKTKSGITWRKNGTDQKLFNSLKIISPESQNTEFESVHIKNIKMMNNEIHYGIYNEKTNPFGYKYKSSLDFLPSVRPFNNPIGWEIMEKIKIAKKMHDLKNRDLGVF